MRSKSRSLEHYKDSSFADKDEASKFLGSNSPNTPSATHISEPGNFESYFSMVLKASLLIFLGMFIMAGICRFWVDKSSETSIKLSPYKSSPRDTNAPNSPQTKTDLSKFIRYFPKTNCKYALKDDEKTHAFIIGPQKTGTTFLTSFLAEFGHFPEILMSNPKETDFAQHDFQSAEEFDNYAWSHRKPEHKVLLESTANTIFEKGFEKVYPHFNNPKFIFIARDPTERFFSHLNHIQRNILAPEELVGGTINMTKGYNIMANNASTPQKLHYEVAKLLNNGLDWFLYHGLYAKWLESWREIRCNSMMILNQKHMTADVLGQVFKHLGLEVPPNDLILKSMKDASERYSSYEKLWGKFWHTLPKPDLETKAMIDDYYMKDKETLWKLLNISEPWF